MVCTTSDDDTIVAANNLQFSYIGLKCEYAMYLLTSSKRKYSSQCIFVLKYIEESIPTQIEFGKPMEHETESEQLNS